MFNGTPTPSIYTLSLHDALPISWPIHLRYCTCSGSFRPRSARKRARSSRVACEPSMISAGSPGERCSTMKMMTDRSEEHTSELQSRVDLVCRLLLEKKNKN